MHDEPWAHAHDPDEERLAKLSIELNNPDHDYYHHEVIELKTVGIDIGSSTSHLMFSNITLQRVQEMHSSRYVVVDRQTLYKSPILLTPYTHDNLINTELLEGFIADSYAEAGFQAQDIDSGAIILTGEAIKRRNAHAIADIFADHAGKFVCASAGHNLESVLAANGSGAVKLSRNPHQTVLNVDIGGGTTKFALVKDGRVAQTATVNVGGRLVATGADGSITRVEEAAHTTADAISVPLNFGEPLSDQSRIAIADALGEVIIDVIQGRPRSELTQALLLTPDMPTDMAYDALVFSGGVSEYIYGNETKDFGDLAMALADAVSRKMAENALPRARTARDGAHQGYGDRCVAIHGSVERQHALHLRHVASAVPKRAGAHFEAVGGSRSAAGGGCRAGQPGVRASGPHRGRAAGGARFRLGWSAPLLADTEDRGWHRCGDAPVAGERVAADAGVHGRFRQAHRRNHHEGHWHHETRSSP